MKKNRDILLIFDCDGVLVDSEPLANRILIQCLQKEGFDVDEAYAYKHFYGISDRDCISHVESIFKKKVSDNFLETLSLLTKEEIKNTLQPISQIKEALAALPYSRCVASGSEPEKVRLSLEVTGLKKYFTHIYSSSQVQRGKPSPDIFLHAAKEMDFTPGQCIVIEDSNAGVWAALNAGMKVLLYRPILKDKSDPIEGATVFTKMAHLPSFIQKIIPQFNL
jgi:HAD superfamily hydrolase (TIGR01509 family)